MQVVICHETALCWTPITSEVVCEKEKFLFVQTPVRKNKS